MNLLPPQEIEEYRAKKEAAKAKAEEKAAEAEKEALKAKRKELGDTLEKRFMASGGTTLEWRRVKDHVVQDALIRLTLDPEPEVEEVKPDIKLPVSRRRYFDR